MHIGERHNVTNMIFLVVQVHIHVRFFHVGELTPAHPIKSPHTLYMGREMIVHVHVHTMITLAHMNLV